MQLSNSVYVVTAKHVLFAKPVGTNPPALWAPKGVVKAFSESGTTNVTERGFILELSHLLNAGEIRYSTNRDVALIRIEDCDPDIPGRVTLLPGVVPLSKPFGIHQQAEASTLRVKDVEVGGDVFVFGYPVSLTSPISSDFDPATPLLRKGIVAGVNLERRILIIDCPSYGGNSGGPVVQVQEPDLLNRKYRVIGIVSRFVAFHEIWENKTLEYSHVLVSNSGYTIVEPIDIALEMVWK